MGGCTLASVAATLDSLVDEIERNFTETQERMSDPAVYNDRREAADAGRRLKELETPYKLAMEWRAVQEDLAAARDDADLRELVPELEARTAKIEEALRLAMVPTDPADRKDVILEVRQGVGGDEAALWAGDVYRMLARYADRRGFKVEELGSSPSDGGGFKEVSSRSRATARIRSSSTKAARTACSASPRPRARGASTRRRRPSR